MQPLDQQRAIEVVRETGHEVTIGDVTALRLAALIQIMHSDGKIPLQLAMERLFPDVASGDAIEKFRKWRTDVKKALSETKHTLVIEVDRNTRAKPDTRHCWFSAANQASKTELFSEISANDALPDAQTIYQRSHILDDQTFNQSYDAARPTYIVGYAIEDKIPAEKLNTLLDTLLTPVATRLGGPLVIKNAPTEGDLQLLKQAQIKILLHGTNSLEALNEDLPGNDENGLVIPARVSPAAQVQWLNRGSFSLKIKGSKSKDFASCTQRAKQEEYAASLVEVIGTWSNAWVISAQKEKEKSADSRGAGGNKGKLLVEHAQIGDLIELNDSANHTAIPSRASAWNATNENEFKYDSENANDLQWSLIDWCTQKNTPAYGAILGELGIGKTTATRLFARHMRVSRQFSDEVPDVYYLDLRHVQDLADAKLHYGELIDRIILRTWDEETAPPKMRFLI